MSRMFVSLLIGVFILCAAPVSGQGQRTARDPRTDQASALMTAGAHVRVKLPGEHAWTGTIVSLADDSMLVRGPSGGDTTLVRLSQVTRLEVSAGKHRSRHFVRNTVIGVGAGAWLGWEVGRGMRSGGCQQGDPCWDDLVCIFGCYAFTSTPVPPVTDHAAAGTVVGALAGGAIALLVSRIRSEDWRAVSVPPRRTAITLSPVGGRIAIAF